jgi:hypothetical protein
VTKDHKTPHGIRPRVQRNEIVFHAFLNAIALSNDRHTIPTMNILNLTAKELKQAAKVKEKITALEKELAKLVGMEMERPIVRRVKRKISDAGRLAIAAAQKLRWSKFKSAKPAGKKRTLNASARAKISKAAKER